MNILGIIPARGGSKGIKNKNIIELAGKPLIGYTIEAALAAKKLDKVVVSTDSRKITGVVNKLYPLEVIKRPAEFSRDDSPLDEALLHAVEYLENNSGFKADIVVLMQANVPIRPPGLIDKVIGKLINSDADSCITCYEVDQIPELMKIINKQGFLMPLYEKVRGIRRQEFESRFMSDGSVNALRADNLFKTRGIREAHVALGKKVLPIVQEKRMYSLELDIADDIALANFYLTNYACSR